MSEQGVSSWESSDVPIDMHIALWNEIAVRTGAADREAFERAARARYEQAELPWHGNVVWVSSPPVLLLAAPMAAVLLEWPWADLEGMAGRALCEVVSRAVAAELRDAVSAAVSQAVRGVPRPGAGETLRRRMRGAWDLLRDGFTGRRALRAAAAGSVGGALLRAQKALDVRVRQGLQSWPWPDPRLRIPQRLQGGLPADGGVGRMRDLVNAAALEERPPQPVPGRGPSRLHRMFAEVLRHGASPWVGDDLGHAALAAYMREVSRLRLDASLWSGARAREQTLQGAWGWHAHRQFAMACEHPREIELTPQRRFRWHRMDGPAIAWPDGWGVYCLQGRRVPGWIIEHPEAITVQHIEHERNAELRRILLERYGWRRFMEDCDAVVVDSVPDSHPIVGLRGARLLSKQLPGESEPLVYLEMVNSTPEVDGTQRRYLERIDPKVYNGDAGRFCHAAMASRWLFRDKRGRLRRTFARWQDYRPERES